MVGKRGKHIGSCSSLFLFANTLMMGVIEIKRVYKKIAHRTKRHVREEIKKRSDKLAETLPKYNSLSYLTVKSDLTATHWLAKQDKDAQDGITAGKLYRLFLDEYDSEHLICDDRNQLGTAYMVHNGSFVILQNSNQWYAYVESLWRKEWEQTDEYRDMIRESMEAVRRAERED